jgi:predicted Zn-dependent protease
MVVLGADRMKKMLLAILLLESSLHAQYAPKTVSITDEEEIKVGQVLAKSFVQEKGIEPTPQTRKIDGYLQKVGDQVAAHAQRKLPYQFHFDPDPSFKSAVALPGGQIFIGGGILAYFDSEDQLAAILGHEIEHVALNHCRDRLVRVLSDQHLLIDDANKLDIQLFMPGYGHDNEFAADREGVRLAMQAGYSANGAIRLLQTFLILTRQMPQTPSESEKNLEERIAQIESLNTAQLPAREKPLTLP